MAMKNKVCLVTGASSGIGESIAILFAKEGASVFLSGRNESRLQDVLKKCVDVSEGKKERFSCAVAEMNNDEDRKRICQTAVDIFGQIDVLVPCAGMMCHAEEFYLETEERYETLMNTNLKSVFFLIQAAVPHLEKTKGSVVLISSVASKIFHPSHVLYHLSKGALDHLCRCLAQALGPKGIRVNSVNPGPIKTRLFRNFGDEDKVEELAQSLTEKMGEYHTLLGRCGTPEEIAQAVLFFASSDSNIVTGQNLVADAGFSLNTAAFYKTF